MSKKIWVVCKKPKHIKIDTSTGIQFSGEKPIETKITFFVKDQLNNGWLKEVAGPKIPINLDEVIFDARLLDKKYKIVQLEEIARLMQIEVSGNKANIIKIILDAHEGVS